VDTGSCEEARRNKNLELRLRLNQNPKLRFKARQRGEARTGVALSVRDTVS